MKVGLKLGVWLCWLGLSAATVVPCAVAQSNNRPPARQQPQPQPSRPPQNNRPAGSYHPQNAPSNRSNQNPRNDSRNDGRNAPRDNGQRNDRPENSYRQAPAVPPPSAQQRLRNMSPQD